MTYTNREELLSKQVLDLFCNDNVEISVPMESKYMSRICGRHNNNLYRLRDTYNVTAIAKANNSISLTGHQNEVSAALNDVELTIQNFNKAIRDSVKIDHRWCCFFTRNFLDTLSQKNGFIEIKILKKLNQINLCGPARAVNSAIDQILYIVSILRIIERVEFYMNLKKDETLITKCVFVKRNLLKKFKEISHAHVRITKLNYRTYFNKSKWELEGEFCLY